MPLSNFWRNLNTDYNYLLTHKDLMNPVDIYRCVVNLLRSQAILFEAAFLPHVDMGIFRVDCHNLQKKIIPYQQVLVKDTERLLLDIFRRKTSEIKVWLQQSIKMLTGMTLRIEEFVLQRTHLEEVLSAFPLMKEERSILEGTYSMFNEEEITYMKEDKDQFNDVLHLESNLLVAISNVEASFGKNIER
jgi:hypothetical protein